MSRPCAALASLVDRSVQRFPGLAPDVLSSGASLYTNTPDEDFLVGPAPGMERATIVGACSGHGFKFTVLMGKIAGRATQGFGTMTELLLRVTAPIRVTARPSSEAPVFSVIDWSAMIVPLKEDPTPRVAELPTCQ